MFEIDSDSQDHASQTRADLGDHRLPPLTPMGIGALIVATIVVAVAPHLIEAGVVA